MEEIKEKSAKKPVSMRLTATASERLMHIIDLYKNLEDPKGEQQENAILRILDIAESDNIRGTHPELEGPLFDTVAPEIDVFEKVLKKFFGGERDNRTLEILQSCDHRNE